MPLRKLPSGIQIFAVIREEDYIYVDKTKYLVNMIDSGKLYFLSRPRRFGKSLTCSTFEAIFQGRKELFEGLYAEEFLNRPGFKPNPVIRLNMNGVTTSKGLDGLEKSILNTINSIAERLGIQLKEDLSCGDALKNLIEQTYQKYGSRVVILIDEYDKPYTDFITEPDMANQARNILRDFYAQVKVCEEYLRFIFITGIAKTAKMGIFSTLNNITDISLDENYGEICGLTEAELYENFTPHLEQVAIKMEMTLEELMAQVKHYYNGFCFDSVHYLYNPYSFLLFLGQKDFLSYWIDTGKSKFLSDYLKDRNLTVEQFKGFPVSKDFIFSPPAEIEVVSPESFLYQCGYLSLRPGTKKNYYALDYPNTEVLNSMSRLLTENLLSAKKEYENHYRNDLLFALEKENVEDLVDVLNRLLASVPHNNFDEAARQDIKRKGYKMTTQEWLCRSCLFSFLQGCGVMVSGEVMTNKGRADLVIKSDERYFVIEIKMLPRTAKEALRQIIDKGYTEPYTGAIALGLAIDEEKRQITEWEVSRTERKV